ncbi:MAG: riboflavin synthase [Alphaproteobacteria bacterium]
MFTGLVMDVGRLRSVETRGDTRFVIETAMDVATVPLGASIACGGACLTVTERDAGWFAVEVSGETLSRTTLGNWTPGCRINLERSLRLGDEIGGHLVSGHVDGVGEIVARRPEGDSLRFTLRVPDDLARFVAPKGSIALDGVSLTVNEVEGSTFGINIIPHTAANTTFGTAGSGDRVNVEIDMLARYVARLLDRS